MNLDRTRSSPSAPAQAANKTPIPASARGCAESVEAYEIAADAEGCAIIRTPSLQANRDSRTMLVCYKTEEEGIRDLQHLVDVEDVEDLWVYRPRFQTWVGIPSAILVKPDKPIFWGRSWSPDALARILAAQEEATFYHYHPRITQSRVNAFLTRSSPRASLHEKTVEFLLVTIDASFPSGQDFNALRRERRRNPNLRARLVSALGVTEFDFDHDRFRGVSDSDFQRLATECSRFAVLSLKRQFDAAWSSAYRDSLEIRRLLPPREAALQILRQYGFDAPLVEP